jgi:glutamate:GABA antiporter
VQKLRYSHTQVHTPYGHPCGIVGVWTSTILVTFWITVGSWLAVFPVTLERVFGVGYTFKPTSG